LQSGGTPALTGITLGTNTVVFPAGIPGNYALFGSVAGATSASGSFGAPSGGTALNILSQSAVRDAVATNSTGNATTTQYAGCQYAVTIAAAGNTVTYSPATIVGTGTMDLFIVSLPTTVLTASEKEQLEIDELQAEMAENRALVASMAITLRRLEGLLTPADREVPTLALGASCGSTPDECKEADLDKSVYVSKGMVAKLLGRK